MDGESGDLTSLVAAARGVVFDKDGTLADLDARWVPFFRKCIDALTSRYDDVALGASLHRALGVDETALVPDGPAAVETPRRIIERIIGEVVALGHDPSGVEATMTSVGTGEGLGPLRPLGDIVVALNDLRGRDLLLGVATSDGRTNTRRELAALGVAEFLPTIRCGDDAAAVKPDPAVLLGIADEWGIGADRILFVGDSRDDLETARGAGSSFVARCHPERVPDWAVHADGVVAEIGQLLGR